MPLNIRVDNPAAYAGAVLPVVQSLDDIIAALPGPVGASDAADHVAGDWVARLGTGRITLTGGTAGVQDGRAVMSFIAVLRIAVKTGAGVDVVPANLLYASRAYFGATATNFQKVFDLGPTEFFFRPTFPGATWQYRNASSTATTLPLAGGAVARRRQYILTRDDTASAELEADGAARASFGPDGAGLGATKLLVGDEAAAAAICGVARLIICTSATPTTDQRAAINTWLAAT